MGKHRDVLFDYFLFNSFSDYFRYLYLFVIFFCPEALQFRTKRKDVGNTQGTHRYTQDPGQKLGTSFFLLFLLCAISCLCLFPFIRIFPKSANLAESTGKLEQWEQLIRKAIGNKETTIRKPKQSNNWRKNRTYTDGPVSQVFILYTLLFILQFHSVLLSPIFHIFFFGGALFNST